MHFFVTFSVAPISLTDTIVSHDEHKRNTSLSTFGNRAKRTASAAASDPTATDVPVYCDRFIVPITENSTFFSPLDPRSSTNTYPPNADCVFVLEGKKLFHPIHISLI